MKLILIALLVGACLTHVQWPIATSTKIVKREFIYLLPGQTYDGFLENGGKWVRYERGIDRKDNCGKIDGDRFDAVFELYNGATLKNVILGQNSIRYVNCLHSECTLENVWFENPCNDAITIENCNIESSKFYIKGGGVKNAKGNIIQHNSAGKVYIQNFYVENSEQLYKSCDNFIYPFQGTRLVYMTNVTALNVETLAGYNANFYDIVTLENIQFTGKHVCRIYEGRFDDKEAKALGDKCQSNSITKCVCN